MNLPTTGSAPYALYVLGTFEMTLQGEPLTGFPTDKTRALLVYLALEPGIAHRREKLAALLWPELSHDLTLRNLRLTLHRLQQTIGDTSPPFLLVDRQSVRLNADNLVVDALRFQQLVDTSGRHDHATLASCDQCLNALIDAMTLYRGELLAGLSLDDAPAFDEWLSPLRERLRQQALAAGSSLVDLFEARGKLDQAHAYAASLLALDPYREESHRQLMRLLARNGQRAEALARAERLRRLLREEIGIDPSFTTTALIEQIAAGIWDDPPQASSLAPPAPMHAPLLNLVVGVPATARLFGREVELMRLQKWLLEEKCCLVAVLGMGGVGKTALAAALANLVVPHFEHVLWHSLLNAPPPDETLRFWLGKLAIPAGAPFSTAPLPTTFDQRVALLLDILRRRRILLLLDNVDTCFEPGRAGQMRPGYEGYDHLFRRLVEEPHRSCLLLTSRQRPHNLARWEEERPCIRTMRLEGLPSAAAQALLAARGVRGDAATLSLLGARYSGNPLALQLAAQSSHELFGSDVTAFLAAGAPVFDDIRSVLDQQFAHLAPVERQILFWLAVVREPLSAPALRQAFVAPPPARDFLAALLGLERRSLLEQARLGTGDKQTMSFSVQNVVMEYITDNIVEAIENEIENEIVHEIRRETGRLDENSAPSAPTLTALNLNQFALVQAHAREYVRQSQIRLLLKPVAEALETRFGKVGLPAAIQWLLARLRAAAPRTPGYAAGNLINLLRYLEVDLNGYDFSRLAIWQADLRTANLEHVNFSDADLRYTRFTESFAIVFALAFSPDGEVLVAGTTNGEIHPWRVTTGDALPVLSGHSGRVAALAFSPDGQFLASGGDDRIVRLWSLAGPSPGSSSGPSPGSQPSKLLTGYSGTIFSLAFSPDGRLLASGNEDHLVRVQDVESGEFVALCHGHQGWVHSVAISPDGSLLASGSFDGTVRLWRLPSGEALQTLHGHSAAVTAVVFSKGGALLVSSSADATLRLWDRRHDWASTAIQVQSRRIWSIAAARRPLLAAGDDNIVRLWDLQSGELNSVLEGHSDHVIAVAFSPDDTLLASGGRDQTVRLWDVQRGEVHSILHGHSQPLQALAFSPDGATLAAGDSTPSIRFFDSQSGQLSGKLTEQRVKAISGVAYHPRGDLLAVCGDDHTVGLWSWPRASGEKGAVPLNASRSLLAGHSEGVVRVYFSVDGALLASSSYDHTVCLWQMASEQLLHRLPVETSIYAAVAFSPDSAFLATGGDHDIKLWECQSGRQLATLNTHNGPIWSLASCPPAPGAPPLLAAGSADGSVCIWDISNPEHAQPYALLQGHHGRVFGLAFTPDGQSLISCGYDFSVRVWDMQRQTQRQLLSGHTNWVFNIAINPDGSLLASASTDESIRLWDLTTYECIKTLHPPGPYDAMQISGVTGISEGQRATLRRLGARG